MLVSSQSAKIVPCSSGVVRLEENQRAELERRQIVRVTLKCALALDDSTVHLVLQVIGVRNPASDERRSRFGAPRDKKLFQSVRNLSLEKKKPAILNQGLDVTRCAKCQSGLKFLRRTVPQVSLTVNDRERDVRLCERGIESERTAGCRSGFSSDFRHRDRFEVRRKRESETQSGVCFSVQGVQHDCFSEHAGTRLETLSANAQCTLCKHVKPIRFSRRNASGTARCARHCSEPALLSKRIAD